MTDWDQGCIGEVCIIVKTKLGTQDVAHFSGQHHQMPQRPGMENFLKSLGQEALDYCFDMSQGKVESIQDYVFRLEILTVALQKDTAINLDEKIRRYWLTRTSNLTEREIFESRSSHRNRRRSRKSNKPSPKRLLQRNVRKSRMISVRQSARPPWWIRCGPEFPSSWKQ